MLSRNLRDYLSISRMHYSEFTLKTDVACESFVSENFHSEPEIEAL